MSGRCGYANFEDWQNSNYAELKREHGEYIEKNYIWVEPDTYVSFDDFCLGTWQRM